MVEVKDLGPLDWRSPIVDSAGRPSPEFQRLWNTQRGNNTLIGTKQGSVGPQGAPGQDGDVGDEGAQGPPGVRGAAGPAGVIGMPGLDGDEGPEGLAIPGPQGAAGPAGAPGGPGPTGAVGMMGLDGDEGPEGMAVPGPVGPQGAAGPTGSTGPAGPVGPLGMMGLDGVDGEEGQPIPGAVGARGSTGPQGAPNAAALDGADGDEGQIGPRGLIGSTGPVGLTGMPGADGIDGEDFSLMGGAYLPLTGGTLSGPLDIGGVISTGQGNLLNVAWTPAAFPTGVQMGAFIAASGPSDPGGATRLFAMDFSANVTGGNNTSNVIGLRGQVSNSSTGTVALLHAIDVIAGAASGATTEASGVSTSVNVSGTAAVTTAHGIRAISPLVSGSGAITTSYGVRVLAQMVAGVTTGIAFASDGASDYSYLAGALSIGKTTDPVNALDVVGSIGVTGVVTSGYQRIVPLTGFSQVINNGVEYLIIDPAGTLATGTVTMPSAPLDGQEVTVVTTKAISNITINGNVGQTMGVVDPGMGNPAGWQKFKYAAGVATWYRVG